jgi:predicted Zn-dependent protease with MMP-like domain
MSGREFERLVDEALEGLPEWVVQGVDNLRVLVADWPTEDQDPDGTGLLGIYEGVSLLERGVDYYGAMPDTITVFRRPHLALGLDREALRDEIRKTVLHEVAHHLGIDDERLHELGFD